MAHTSPPTAGRRARRIADTKARVIDVSLSLFASQGFASTTVDEIIAAADVSRASFFRYFDGKDAVLFHELTAPQTWILAQIHDRPADEAPLASAIMACCSGPWPSLNRPRLRKIRGIMSREPLLARAQRLQVSETFTRQLVECFEERCPDLPDIEVHLAADLAVSWMLWAVTQHVLDGKPTGQHFRHALDATRTMTGALDGIVLPPDENWY